MSSVSYFLLERKTAITQYLETRRNGDKVSGVFVVHTWESAPDWVGPDSGFENNVDFLLRRTNYGSYHFACDSDSGGDLVPWWMEAFHCRFTNNHSVGGSMMTKASKWKEAPREWREAVIKRLAEWFAKTADEIYLDDGSRTRRRGIDVPAEWRTREEAIAGVPGFVRHGTTDPGRRYDPWPEDSPEAALLMAYYKAARRTGRYAGDLLPPASELPKLPPTKPKPPAPTPAPRISLRRGSHGHAVGVLQRWLRVTFPSYRWRSRVQRGRLIWVDENYGYQTEEWVRIFQRRTGLHVDGWFGPKTLAEARRYGLDL